ACPRGTDAGGRRAPGRRGGAGPGAGRAREPDAPRGGRGGPHHRRDGGRAVGDVGADRGVRPDDRPDRSPDAPARAQCGDRGGAGGWPGMRLVHAAYLFSNPGLSVADVAYRLDYSSPQSFGRHLKAMLGVTAGEFRRRFPFEVALERYVDLLITPYRETLRAFCPLNAGLWDQ